MFGGRGRGGRYGGGDESGSHHSRRQVSDYQINGCVRRELVGRNVDLKNLQYRTSNGSVEISGRLKFKEPKSPSEYAKELFILEQNLLAIRGVRKVKIEVDEWEKSARGTYMRTQDEDEDDKKSMAQKRLDDD